MTPKLINTPNNAVYHKKYLKQLRVKSATIRCISKQTDLKRGRKLGVDEMLNRKHAKLVKPYDRQKNDVMIGATTLRSPMNRHACAMAHVTITARRGSSGLRAPPRACASVLGQLRGAVGNFRDPKPRPPGNRSPCVPGSSLWLPRDPAGPGTRPFGMAG